MSPFGPKLHFTVKAVHQMRDNHHPRHSRLPEAAWFIVALHSSQVSPHFMLQMTLSALSEFGERERENGAAEINNT